MVEKDGEIEKLKKELEKVSFVAISTVHWCPLEYISLKTPLFD